MDQELTYKWIQDRLRDLHAGQLTAQDKARLEHIAREDPFLADALEGYHAHPDALHEAYLAALAEKIRHTPRARRRWLIPNLTVTAIAASVMLIIATYAVITRMSPDEEQSLTVILSPDSLMTGDTSLKDAVVWNEEGPTDSPPSTVGQQPVKTNKEIEMKAPSGAAQSGKTGEATKEPKQKAASKEEEKNALAEPVPPPATAEDAIVPAARQLALDEGLYANQMDPGLMARRVTGRVVSRSGVPLTGADIRIANTNLGVTSREEGQFELYLPLPQSEVQIFLPGYTEANVTLQQGETDKDIVLEPSPVDMVTGAEKAISQKSMQDDTAMPAAAGAARARGETDEWITYLNTQSKIPLRENFYMPGKEVTVQFTVKPNGKADAIQLIRSSGDTRYDDEAVRLIRRWDKWRCEGMVCEKEYTLYFR